MYIKKTALCKEAQSISKITKKREKQKRMNANDVNGCLDFIAGYDECQ